MEMGNVSGRKEEAAGPSGVKSSREVEEEFDMEYYAHGGGAQVSYFAPDPVLESMVQSPTHTPPRASKSPLMFTPQVPMVPSQRPDEMMQTYSDESKQRTVLDDDLIYGKGIPTVITWIYDGKQVVIEGSWDNWKKRELLQKSGKDFTIMKVLPSGVYHYRFIVDGQPRYAPDLPRETDDMGNIFNILDLQDHVPEFVNDISETPPSPESSYNSAPFTLEDLNEKLPELPPLLQQTPLDQPLSTSGNPECLEKPLSTALNHLYIQKGSSGQSMVCLSSTHRFHKKYVTLVLYKPLKKLKK